MIDFLIRSWFESKEKRTKKAFSRMEKTLFADRVDEIKSFCDRCWDSEEWKNVEKIHDERFPDVTSSALIPIRYDYYDKYIYSKLADAYGEFASIRGAGMDSLIRTYNEFYDELCRNTDLKPSEINIYGCDDRITYELYRDRNGNFKPAFDHYASGWSRKYHMAYCAMANLMLIIRKSCNIIEHIRLNAAYENAYSPYSYYRIMRKDRPAADDDNAVYAQTREKLESELLRESDAIREKGTF